jgi:hypothetical protein
VISVKGPATARRRARSRTAWEAAHGGVVNAHRPAVMFGDALDADDGHAGERAVPRDPPDTCARRSAAVYGVPLQRIQAIVDNASQGGGKGLDAIDAGYVKHGLLPTATRSSAHGPDAARGDQGSWAAFDFDEFLRADAEDRAEIARSPRRRRSARSTRSAPTKGWEPLPDGRARTRSHRSTPTRRRPAAPTTHRSRATREALRREDAQDPPGGSSRVRAALLDGDTRAMRALVRQASGPNTLDLPFRDVELRGEAGRHRRQRLLFTGYASVVEQPYTMQDWLGPTPRSSATARSRRRCREPDVVFCLNHDWDAAPMARTKAGTLRLSEDDDRAARPRPTSTASAPTSTRCSRAWRPASSTRCRSRSGSPGRCGRRTTSSATSSRSTSTAATRRSSPGRPTRPPPARPPAQAGSGALARSRVPRLLVERARTEKRAGAKLSAATIDTLQEVLDLIAEADVAVDAAQELLSELMGVPNPDDDAVLIVLE